MCLADERPIHQEASPIALPDPVPGEKFNLAKVGDTHRYDREREGESKLCKKSSMVEFCVKRIWDEIVGRVCPSVGVLR